MLLTEKVANSIRSAYFSLKHMKKINSEYHKSFIFLSLAVSLAHDTTNMLPQTERYLSVIIEQSNATISRDVEHLFKYTITLAEQENNIPTVIVSPY